LPRRCRHWRPHTRHAPDHAGRFVLRDHAAAGRDDVLAAAHTVGAHAGQDHGENVAVPDVDGRGEERIDRGLAEIDGGAVVERDRGLRAVAHDAHMLAARREIDPAGLHRLTIDRLG
jgi:hypothetical protein